MTKEQFVVEMIRINEKRKELSLDEEKAKEEYWNANHVFDAGDKVSVLAKRGAKGDETIEAYVRGSTVHSDGQIEYSLLKAKKDGSPSINKLYWYDYHPNTIQLIQKATTNE